MRGSNIEIYHGVGSPASCGYFFLHGPFKLFCFCLSLTVYFDWDVAQKILLMVYEIYISN